MGYDPFDISGALWYHRRDLVSHPKYLRRLAPGFGGPMNEELLPTAPSEPSETDTAAGQPERAPSVWSLLIDLLVRPGHAFGQIVRWQGLRWLLPAVLVVIASVVLVVVSAPYAAEEARRMARVEAGTMPPEQAEMVLQQAERFSQPVVVAVSGAVSAVVVQVLIWLAISAILYFGVLIAGGEATYAAAWTVTPWLYIPFALGNTIQAIWVYFRQGLVRYQGLSALVATGDLQVDARNPLYGVLSQVEPFLAWHAFLVYWALRGGLKVSGRTAFWLTVVYLALRLGVSAVPAFIARAF